MLSLTGMLRHIHSLTLGIGDARFKQTWNWCSIMGCGEIEVGGASRPNISLLLSETWGNLQSRHLLVYRVMYKYVDYRALWAQLGSL